jgi:ankyrin repeat protein
MEMKNLIFGFLILVSINVFAGPRLIDEVGEAIGRGNSKQFFALLPKLKNVDETFNKIGETPLTLAAYNDRADMVEALIKRGAKVNHQTTNGYSALIFAAMVMNPPPENALKTVKVLLAAGADKKLKNSDGKTAYDMAMEKKAQAIAELVK